MARTVASRLSEEDLRRLLNARLRGQQAEESAFDFDLSSTVKDKEKSPQDEFALNFAKQFILDHLCEVQARRLKENDFEVPLVQSEDLKQVSRQLLDLLPSDSSVGSLLKELAGDRDLLEKVIDVFWDQLFVLFEEMSWWSTENRRRLLWKEIKIVLALAKERNEDPVLLLEQQEFRDEVTRCMYTKKEYILSTRQALAVFLDAQKLFNIVGLPLILLFDDFFDEEDSIESVKKAFLPRLQEGLFIMRGQAEMALDKNVARIWG